MPELTDSDQDLIRRARKLENADDVCKYTGEADLDVAYARAFGRSKDLLKEVTDRLEQVLGGS